MNIITEPRVYLVGRQNVDRSQVDRFLDEYGMSWETDTEVGGEGRKTNAEYISNIIGQKHGSVLEHAVWNFILAGVSPAFTHELIRHRAGWGYSQLSQRYVDESMANYIEPGIIAEDERLHAIWLRAVEQSHQAYLDLVAGLMEKLADVDDRTHRRKLARQAARPVLPNATATMLFVTANPPPPRPSPARPGP